MPEGDTLHRVANRLRPALVGQTLTQFEAPRLTGPRPAPGTVISSVDAVGKHLLVRFDGGIVLRTHLRMTGSWHIYRTGERWQKPPHLARVVLGVQGWVAVCFSAPVVETTVEPDGRPDAVGHLGPDLCLPGPDLDDALRRMAYHADATTPIVDVLLDQRVAAGIGNVYKSEVLWARGVHPSTLVADLGDDIRRALLDTAATLLRANLTTVSRTTVPGGLAVYGRAGSPCRRCGDRVRRRRDGAQARSTFWCPTCQPAPGSPPARPGGAPDPVAQTPVEG
ncbi:MAG: DNA-formamidopyrimidine glycosylase family protein [Acidimicrobiales bacterium]